MTSAGRGLAYQTGTLFTRAEQRSPLDVAVGVLHDTLVRLDVAFGEEDGLIRLVIVDDNLVNGRIGLELLSGSASHIEVAAPGAHAKICPGTDIRIKIGVGSAVDKETARRRVAVVPRRRDMEPMRGAPVVPRGVARGGAALEMVRQVGDLQE